MSDLFTLDGRTAIITGSSRGIGYAIARTFLAQGANVVINGFDAEETAHAVAALRVLTGEHHVSGIAGDITDAAVIQSLVDTAVSEHGGFDHLVCNAGIDIIKPALEYDVDEWDRILRVNLRGAFQPAQAAARWWVQKGQQGSVTVTSSIAGSVGIPTLAPYAASKGGINQMIRTLASEWAEYGIRVNAIAPGYVDNIMDAVTAHDDPTSDIRISTFTPLGRRASVDEIAAPYAFLASAAAAYITGAVLAVDGGYTAT